MGATMTEREFSAITKVINPFGMLFLSYINGRASVSISSSRYRAFDLHMYSHATLHKLDGFNSSKPDELLFRFPVCAGSLGGFKKHLNMLGGNESTSSDPTSALVSKSGNRRISFGIAAKRVRKFAEQEKLLKHFECFVDICVKKLQKYDDDNKIIDRRDLRKEYFLENCLEKALVEAEKERKMKDVEKPTQERVGGPATSENAGNSKTITEMLVANESTSSDPTSALVSKSGNRRISFSISTKRGLKFAEQEKLLKHLESFGKT
ncbi:hypothetical protein HNY73_011171 [Argiope bruennichi]|uniref:Uncharacterized protein n=1 Tax=Argiope bruennichi TaxID=94029 RepID=A0A8T0F397_ARGBR|nr:hypothetical protein HNY73_011171 [Argiope bruennichi]